MAEESCRICMAEEMERPCRVKGCGHSFCHSCIRQWGKARESPTCPLCNSDLKTIVLEAGLEEEIEPGRQAEDGDPDLACIDHTVVLADVNRLIERSESLRGRVYSTAYGSSRRGTSDGDTAINTINDVLEVLAGYRTYMQAEIRFEPSEVFSDLYRLDRIVTALQGGQATGCVEDMDALSRHPYRHQPPPRWTQDDDFYDGLHDYYDHEDDDGLWDLDHGSRRPQRSSRSGTGRSTR